jgi:prepilin-type N-terminal cleavage/methylation domain-containing protein
MKNAFSMIELIFVIVIIGILAVIAIPKLNATRDDASMVVDVNNLANCINDISSSYTSSKKENKDTQSCKSIICAKVNLGNINDGAITVTLLDSSNNKPKFCNYAKKLSKKKKLDGVHKFGGNKINL